ncbi:MAG: glutathione S-transferase, partial [Myxococcales bacterium]
MIRVHHLNNSRSQRVLWLLEELKLEYEIIRYQRQANMLAPPELKRVHPLGKSPVIEAGGRVLAESGAIVEALIDQYAPGTLAPARGTPEHGRYLYFMHYAEGSLMPPLLLRLVLGKLGPLGWPALPFVKKQLTTHLDFLEGELKADYFLGDELSGADIMMSFPLEAAASRAGLDASRP